MNIPNVQVIESNDHIAVMVEMNGKVYGAPELKNQKFPEHVAWLSISRTIVEELKKEVKDKNDGSPTTWDYAVYNWEESLNALDIKAQSGDKK